MRHKASQPTPLLLRPAYRLFALVAKWVKTGDPSATLDRFFTSQHVKDLRVIIVVALTAVQAVFVIGSLLSIEHEWYQLVPADLGAKPANASTEQPEHIVMSWTFVLHLLAAPLQSFLTFFGPVLAVFGALVAWAYQAGSARLGVVDLFACEISTLCRVSTILDVITTLTKRLSVDRPPAPSIGPPTASSSQFNSQEDYFPVFENNTKDLQSLEADVVVNITAFYTYMKAVRDAMRALAQVPFSLNEAAPNTPRHAASRDAIYLLYLGLESGRNAIHDLVEFDPERAERTIVVLISELAAYGFLRREFSSEDDMRCRRLKLREPIYQGLIPNLCKSVEEGWRGRAHHDWEPAWLLLPELDRRYEEAVPDAATHLWKRLPASKGRAALAPVPA